LWKSGHLKNKLKSGKITFYAQIFFACVKIIFFRLKKSDFISPPKKLVLGGGGWGGG
jgi:hypothetical protein